ncbi:MAG: lytic transglycosylase domain-containing protein [Firmicutes bacterium]|nr:lytic transglycosylase domain-containing protein [Bacillota bacterium]
MICLSLPVVLREVFPIRYTDMIATAAENHGVDWILIAAVIQVESGYRPAVVSKRGAVGLMQLMPETAFWISERAGRTIDTDDLTDPQTNIELGTYYLHYLLDRFPTEQAALAAYNGGPSNVSRWLGEGIWDGSYERTGGIPFAETRSYVRKVTMMRRLYQFLYQ